MGLNLSAQERIPVRKAAPLAEITLPQSVDNSIKKYFPPLIDQIGGSCAQASYIGYMYTYEMNRLLDRDASVSDSYRYSYLYTWNFINEGKDQGSFGYEGLSIAMANGVMTVADYPRSSSVYSYYWANGYSKYYRAMANRVKYFVQMDAVTEDDLKQIKRYLYDHGDDGSSSDGKVGGVVTFSSRSTNWKFNNNYTGPSQTGYKSLLTELATEGGHAMTIVGYDDLVEFTTPSGDISKGAFIVVNSWGSWSHDNGRFYLPYWFFLNREGYTHSDLSTEVCAIDVEYREPKICFCISVDCDCRNNLSFSIGTSSMKDSQSRYEHKVAIADYQGGPYKMCGQYAESRIEMGFDFSSYVRFMDELESPSFYLTINRNSRDGKSASYAKLCGFKVYDYRENAAMPKIYTYEVPSNGIELVSGKNVFRLESVEPKRISRNPIQWIAKSGKPTTSPIIFRTADGKYAKLRFYEYDREAGTLRIKYVYSPSGDNNIE